jgi:hypothetical protein
MFLLGGPADEYPANFFILFFVANIQLRENLEKSYGPQTDQSTISADRDFYTSRSPPPTYRSIHDQSLKKSPILAMSRHNARRAQCRDVARIGTNVAPRAFFTSKNAPGSIY